jgi:phage terminase large subunit
MIPQVELPAKLVPIFTGEARYRGAWGGRGSGKTRSFAKMLAVKGIILAEAGETGLLVGGREFMNSLSDSSFAEIKAAIASEPWLAERYDVGEQYIRTKDRRIDFAFVGLRHNLDSIKSKAKIHVLWIDEAERVSETAWQIVIPTVREVDSELWITWNPEQKKAPTNKRFREDPPENARIIEMNWRDNPWFPKVLNDARLEDKAKRPDQYEHIWEGAYKTMVEGAYYARHLADAKREGRIGRVPIDPLMTVRLFADIGGTGAKSDNFVFVAAQFIAKEIRVVDHYEVQGQPIGHHLDWLRSRGYSPDRAQIWLPHDGSTHDKVFDVSYESAFKKAGYKVTVIKNQGAGAAMARIESLRNRFPYIWFNEETTKNLIQAVGWYHEKRDELRDMGLGPDHDWSSHSADAIGMMAIAYEEPVKKPDIKPIHYITADAVTGY